MDRKPIVAMVSGKYTPVDPKNRADALSQIERNIFVAKEVAKCLWGMGYAVICPQTNSGHFDDVAPPKYFYEGYLELVRRSDIIVMLPNWEESYGARLEYELAKKLGKEVYLAEISEDNKQWVFIKDCGHISDGWCWKVYKKENLSQRPICGGNKNV